MGTNWSGTGKLIRSGVIISAMSILFAQVVWGGGPVSGVAMHGDIKYPANFAHFDYVNPKAPKGGTLKLFSLGNFDSFNPYISKGIAAEGVTLLYESLVTQSKDEAFSIYGLVAETIEIAPDRGWVAFNLRQNATFSDGTAITADDILFSFELVRTQGKPAFSFFYEDVATVNVESKHRIKFSFKHNRNRELPLTIGTFPIFSKAFWENKDFKAVNLEYPLGSGPYRVKSHQPGKQVVYARNPNYWGKDLGVNKGRYNFDTISYDYYLDQTVALEAFKSGEYHYRSENNSKFWATSYQGANFDNQNIKVEEITHQEPVGMQGFVFNLRNPLFKDPILREAMSMAFNFEWSNQNLFYGQYKRTRSFFENTELAATQLPNEAELKILAPYKDKIPERVFTQAYNPIVFEKHTQVRRALGKAARQLKTAGYKIENNLLKTPAGKTVQFEFLMYDSAFERIVLPMVKNLKTLGILATPRKVDLNQYVERLREYKFDMIVTTFGQSLSPGNEQRNYWSSASANKRDSRNWIGLQDPVVDALVEKLILAKSRTELIHHSRALDRILQWNHYVIPNWHLNYHRLAYWQHLKRPDIAPYGLDLMAWWVEQPLAQHK